MKCFHRTPCSLFAVSALTRALPRIAHALNIPSKGIGSISIAHLNFKKLGDFEKIRRAADDLFFACYIGRYMTKTAGIIVIGNEILSGKTRDENSLYLTRELRELGVDVRQISVIPDELGLISHEVREFSGSFHYVFTTGGVGPTHDDLTMESIAAAFGRKIYRHPELENTLRGYYGRDSIEGNLRMADIPEGARLLGGPGMWFPVIAVENVYIFPGVPEILRRKFERIKETFREDPYYLREIFLRADEGQIASILHRILAKYPNLMLGSYPYFDNPVYSIKLTLESKDAAYLDQAHALLLDELGRIGVAPVK